MQRGRIETLLQEGSAADRGIRGAPVTTTYFYNSANQLTSKTHSDTTGTESYSYGTSPSLFNVGRLTTMTDPSGSEAYSYDTVGRVKQVIKTIGTTAYTMQYSYNAGGQLTGITYPSGRVVQYGYDNVGHLCKVATFGHKLLYRCWRESPPNLTLPSYDASGRPISCRLRQRSRGDCYIVQLLLS